MSSQYPILDNRPIDQWKVVELKEELKRRKLTTKGLKDDLVKRLDEAIRAELADERGASHDGSDNNLQLGSQSENYEKESIATEAASDAIDDSQPKNVSEEGKIEPFVTRETEATMDNGSHKVDPDMLKDVGSRGSVDEGKVAAVEVVNAADSGLTVEMQVGQVPLVEPAVIVSEDVAPMISSNGQDLQRMETHNETGDLKVQLEKDDSSKAQLGDDSSKSTRADGEFRSLHADDESSGPDNQVSEVCPDLGVQVLSDSISTEPVSINETNELKDNIIADDVKLELDVKPEMVQLSSSTVVHDGGDAHPMDVSEPHVKNSSIEETSGNLTANVDIVKSNDIDDMGSPEKLNLDRSSGDDSMEEDVSESKQIDLKSNSHEMEVKAEKIEASRLTEEEGFVDVVGDDISEDTQVANIEIEKDPAAISVKRKLHDQSGVGNNDVTKRQRRWNSESLKLPGTESSNTMDSTTPKDTVHPTFKRSFSKSDSKVSEEAPKERVVPPSPKPPTNSLRIDRFLRPFTLKAVQELLGKTGTVTGFWMDHIKTHCYVSYSSVEEAIETRNAVYNLQWPSNGGRQLIAEFVDPQEVKVRVDPPLHSPATPVTMLPSFAPLQPTRLPQPSPWQHSQRQQLPPPPSVLPPPPPPPLINPPSARDYPPQAREQLPPAREQLLPPPPPPVTEKVDPPIVTLDDLFRKTKATPRIYYLQLSDEQVAAKLKAQGKNIN